MGNGLEMRKAGPKTRQDASKQYGQRAASFHTNADASGDTAKTACIVDNTQNRLKEMK